MRELKLIALLVLVWKVLSHLHGCVNWNEERIPKRRTENRVAPSRVRELKLRKEKKYCLNGYVAPSRVRELKPGGEAATETALKSHLHGCVNWNPKQRDSLIFLFVAPSRVRELKQVVICLNLCSVGSHLHGCVNWNQKLGLPMPAKWRRTFTGAWIETYCIDRFRQKRRRRTFTGAWIETYLSTDICKYLWSHLHGCVNWNSI